jgi:hypothetical protein
MGTGADHVSAMNNRGAIVGDSFFNTSFGNSLIGWAWFPDTGFVTLDNLVGAGFGYRFETVTGINDAGQIVGYGVNGGGLADGFLLTPIPEPSSLFLISMSILVLSSWSFVARAGQGRVGKS